MTGQQQLEAERPWLAALEAERSPDLAALEAERYGLTPRAHQVLAPGPRWWPADGGAR